MESFLINVDFEFAVNLFVLYVTINESRYFENKSLPVEMKLFSFHSEAEV